MLLALLLACGPPGLSRGVWLSSANGNRYALVFEHSAGLVSGTMGQLHDGKQVVQWGFAGTWKRTGELEIAWGNDNSITATVDLNRDEIRGRLRLAGDGGREVVLRRTPAADVPGLAALSVLPYHLRPPAPAVARGDAGLLHSLVIIRRGQLVLEEYFHGYGREDLHELQSSTKSVTSLLVGIARDRGAILGMEQPVLEFFPEQAAMARPGWEAVRLEHLLTMTAGLDWDRREVFRDRGIGPRLFDKVLSRRVMHEPGSRWLYNGPDMELLAGVLRHATGMQADELAAEALFGPLGITEWDWELGKTEGYPSLAGTLHLRPLDMAKIGQLVLDGGRWRGEQVISQAWIEESTVPRIATAAGRSQRYGYLWWRLDAPIDAGPHPVIVASGWGSQFIHIVPALEAVIVTTGGNQMNGENWAIGEVLVQHLVPGVKRPQATPG
jgi:CubicO group peptidase (beta-lactamase class C family)